MKIDFNIINSILFGNLRPNQNNLYSDSFKNIILQIPFKEQITAHEEFDKAFISFTKKNQLY